MSQTSTPTTEELTELVSGLKRLARNLWWTWDQDAQEIFDRDEAGIPRQWIMKIRHAMATLVPKFTTMRMVQEYTEKYYKR